MFDAIVLSEVEVLLVIRYDRLYDADGTPIMTFIGVNALSLSFFPSHPNLGFADLCILKLKLLKASSLKSSYSAYQFQYGIRQLPINASGAFLFFVPS